MNAFRKGRRLICLDDVTISVLVEREIRGERVPEPLGIRAAQGKPYRRIHEEIRAAQEQREERMGALSGATWVRLIPAFLMRAFMRVASRNIRMMARYGTIGVTAVGMFSEGAAWFVPLSTATVTVTVGSIVLRESREHLCVTVGFDHDIVDGAPAARFLRSFAAALKSGELLRQGALDGDGSGAPEHELDREQR